MQFRPPPEFPDQPLKDIPAGGTVEGGGTEPGPDLAPPEATGAVPDITAPPERGAIEVNEGLMSCLASATFADIARIASGRGPYVEHDLTHTRETCLHLGELRALTDRSRDLAALAVQEAVDLVEVGERLRAEYEQREYTYEAITTCIPACRDEDFAHLREAVTDPERTALLMEAAAEYGRMRRPISLEGEHDAIARIVDASSVDDYFTFSRVSGRSRESIREVNGSCVQETYLTQQHSREIGVETGVMCYTRPPFFAHYFLRMEIEGSEPLFVDRTWQQFTPKGCDRSTLPHTLIVPASRVTEAVEMLGVPDEDQGVWASAKPCSTNWWEFCSTPLNTIINTDGWYDAAQVMLPSLRALLQAARR
jgi:hypothetical protein